MPLYIYIDICIGIKKKLDSIKITTNFVSNKKYAIQRHQLLVSSKTDTRAPLPASVATLRSKKKKDSYIILVVLSCRSNFVLRV